MTFPKISAALVAALVTSVSFPVLAAPVLDSQLAIGGSIDSIGYDSVTGNLYVHLERNADIRVISQAGVQQFTISAPGSTSNDFDLDFAESTVSVGGTSVAANSLLVFNGDDGPETLRALDKNTGAILASVALPSGSLVGGAHHAVRGSVFTVDFIGNDLVREINPSTGVQSNSFSPQVPVSFNVDYGDIDVYSPTGNLFIVSSIQNTVREVTPDGAFVRDIDLDVLGISGMSGIAIDAINDIAWISSINGNVYEVSGLFTPVPLPGAIWLFLSGGVWLVAKRRAGT